MAAVNESHDRPSMVWIPSPSEPEEGGSTYTPTDTETTPSPQPSNVSFVPALPEPLPLDPEEDSGESLKPARIHPPENVYTYSPQSAVSSSTVALWALIANAAVTQKIARDMRPAGLPSPPALFANVSNEKLREKMSGSESSQVGSPFACSPAAASPTKLLASELDGSSSMEAALLQELSKIQRVSGPSDPHIRLDSLEPDQKQVLSTCALPEQDDVSNEISLRDLEPVKFHHRLSPSQVILGRGTYGVVRLMRQKSTGKYYAVKSLDRSIVASTGMESQVKLEILAQRLVSHPNTVRCYNVVTDAKHYHLILDYCSRGDLFRKLRSAPNRRLVEVDAFRLFLQLISGLLHIHSLGFCHRDLKLENLLLDEQNNLKIADFGWVARINGYNRSYNFCGTLDYLSPEMVQGIGHDYRVDLWAVGVLLFELLSGKPPFLSTRHFELLDRILFARIHQDKLDSQSIHVKEDALEAVQAFLKPDANQRIQFKDILNLRWVQRMLNEIYQVFLDSWRAFAPLLNQNTTSSPAEDNEAQDSRVALERAGSPHSDVGSLQSTPITGTLLSARGLGLGPRRRANAVRMAENQLASVLRGPFSSHSALNHKRYSSGGSASPRPIGSLRHNSAASSLTRSPPEPWNGAPQSQEAPSLVATDGSETTQMTRNRSGSGGDLGLHSLVRPMRLRRPPRDHPFLSTPSSAAGDEERRANRAPVPRATSPALRQSSPRREHRTSQWNESTKSEDLRASLMQSSDTTNALLTRRRSSDKLDSSRTRNTTNEGHSASLYRSSNQLPRRSRHMPTQLLSGLQSRHSHAGKPDRSSASTVSGSIPRLPVCYTTSATTVSHTEKVSVVSRLYTITRHYTCFRSP
eukprot:Blabericola_migrator_1__10953@NODE_633_length_7142_cov_112_965230_g464_i0_p1_GENE_NODE_633_length_7142_cov_112_965230_g464_i0NODE_633_length_7142_cov_112_965230_g464_i0_p1_ORF_typecomplete_len863_score91_23Pkinase/PF00069_25/2e62Pkinase_Tyr/PF07714_17/6_8e03Pkinase_Tyr/PF07714_17/1_5e42Kinaselike/PF14531_6/4_9e14Pkinase_fungal/PF17667_1/6_4e07Kdo/PF06293_14/3_9e03Kdo/PF06293_14/2_7e05RIO1/PF01163_22/0_0011APH/PF01636_23/0_0013APH/PF01636_23/2_5e03APH/PF01636_23/2_2e03WaaY/PF06176_11/0_003Choline